MNPSQIKNATRKLENKYIDDCNKILDYAREKYIIPFCEKHQCKFLAGMGTWMFMGGDIKHIWEYEDSKLTKELSKILSMDYPLNRGNSLGSMMLNYTPKNYKESNDSY